MKLNKVSRDSVVVATPDQVSADLEDEAVVLHLKDGVYYGLNPLGARIWNLLAQPRAIFEIQDILLEEYDVEPQVLEEDLLRLLGELAERGLIEVRSEESQKSP
jgi:Coenzyme PQQ synthesis protein D (PqqD)